MSPARRIAIGLTLTALLLAAGAAWTISVMRTWDARGWTGVLFIRSGTHRPAALGPGRVLMTFPNSPAMRAGIRGGDRILAINRIPLTDLDRLQALDARIHTGDTIVYTIDRNGRVFETGHVRLTRARAASAARSGGDRRHRRLLPDRRTGDLPPPQR
jgi:membrane-associated protease RseP (regulator of RpoE activity)